MSATRTPNHPVIVSGHFEPLSPSEPETTKGSQYGFVSTLSYFQCAGYGGNKADAFEVVLKTNTLLTHTLEVGFIYSLTGKLIAMNDGTLPIITYFENSLVKVCEAGDNQPDFKSKTTAIGLGHVSKREEVVGSEEDGGTRLEVEVVHHDWDAQAKFHRRFLIKYIIPSSKNMVKTQTLYVVGRETDIVGILVDFDVAKSMAIVLVNAVSLTSGHMLGRLLPSASGSEVPSPRKGLKFVKLSPRKEQSASQLSESPNVPLTPTKSNDKENDLKGKRKQASDNEDESEVESDLDKLDSMEIEVEETQKSKSTRGSPRKSILQAAAKRMKRL
ncbi:hypothetical protein MJO28_008814 [Puccinia striiformis f. sp. tritici]|uniref:Uncharacterized protein n=1 Tax=Puccinia striiformis f. sp. tritici TaxID=168172 RepID=A0ACC0EC42_9BASI|nr:hypothetical protein MJO28_008814 [Puccinia striiformis f. sp. tritici]KAI7953057.1 hypothetical protein MJO29_008688 [Puccinia striiformis f. sp. tritici]